MKTRSMSRTGNVPVGSARDNISDNEDELTAAELAARRNANNAGRQSPQTYVRDVDSPREYNIPIRQTGQPASGPTPPPLSARPYPSSFTATPAEKVPFLPSADYSTEPGRLALVRGDDMGDKISGQPTWQSKISKAAYIRNDYARCFMAEFLGSLILIVFGNGAVAEVVLSGKKDGGPVNDFFSINIAYGLAVGFGVYIAGGVSGGHLNPAVTLAFALKGALSWIKVPIYWLGQYLGCIVGSAIIYVVYYDAFYWHDGGYRQTYGANATAGIFASYPEPHLTWQGGLIDQIFSTSFLMIGILALTDERNMAPHKGVVPILVAMLVTAIGLSYGYNCGYPINPARDLGPRIFTSMAGWGLEPFSFRDHNWFWIPVIGPHLGAIMGLGIYQLFIGNQWPAMQRTGIELQVVRKGIPDEYELVKSSHVTPSDANVPVTFRTNDGQTERLLSGPR